MSVTVCGSSTHFQRLVVDCPTCDRERRMVASHPASPWYAPTVTCCVCGEQWSGGEMLPRPFRPGWRDDQAARARDRWAVGSDDPPPRDDHANAEPDAP